ncbi:MAG TPA: SAM-dependent methyltransferase [Acidimicrobiia bacterium]|nr:SAM-dependent methyltransferase [Acidimicrobiia bacterium]
MSDCCNRSAYGDFFDDKEAKRRLRDYEKNGLDGMARKMVDYLVSRGMSGRTVLEAGGGIGAIQVELLGAGASSATNVELSNGYEAVAASLLRRNGLDDRVDRLIGDFTALAPDLEADDVVMNRVICCYPFMQRLVGAATSSSRRFVAATFPRDHIGVRVALALGNTYCRIKRIDFRSFIHSPDEVLATGSSAGFEVVFHERDFVWNAVVFERLAS